MFIVSGRPTLSLCPPTLSAVSGTGRAFFSDPMEKEGRIMQKSDPPATPAEPIEPSLQLEQENATLHDAIDVLLARSAEFARRQAEVLAGIAEMARGLTRNEGLAQDRARLAVVLEIFSEECAVEVSEHLGSLAAIGALRRSTGEDSVQHPWPFMVSIRVH
jgi:hypothetical protein